MQELREELAELISAPALDLGIALGDLELDDLATYADELQTWAPRLNLVSDASTEVIARRHILDSLAGAAAIRTRLGDRPCLLDLGSGAGLPGIPLGIVLRAEPMFLVEPRQRRAHFLRAVARRLPDRSFSVLCTRADALPKEQPQLEQRLDAVVSRATFANPETFLRFATPLVKPGGLAIRWCRSPEAHERTGADIPFAPVKPEAYELPGQTGKLHLEIHERLA